MKLPSASSSSSGSSKSSFAFALSNLLADKMARSLPSTSGLSFNTASRLQARLSNLAGTWSTSRIDVAADYDKDWLITRCSSSQMARLDREGGCFCGTLADTESTLCDGFDEGNDRRTVCVEDLRETTTFVDNSVGTSSQPKRKRATCGLEFLVGLEPLSGSCPVGYSRIGKEGETELEEGEEDELFICRDTASPYSCGREQVDCYAQEGVLRTQCKNESCDIQMCQEGWRFRLTDVEEGESEGSTKTSCVKAKPLFFTSDTTRF
ncbi:hypothetical protein JCM5353_005807 [Sporobolomyces roseus]